MYKYNIFHTPHKAWRAALNDLLAKVKVTDYTDLQQVRSTTQFARCVFAAHHAHTQSENNVLGPALQRPELAHHWVDVHGWHNSIIQRVKDHLSVLEKYNNPAKMTQVGGKLKEDLEHFIADDNMHTHLEEGFMSMYARLYNEQELFDLDVKATSYWNELSDDVKDVILPYFIRAHSGDDLVRIMKIFKEILNSKPEAWQKFSEMAKKELKPKDAAKIESMNLFA